jgi:hypothetical protein
MQGSYEAKFDIFSAVRLCEAPGEGRSTFGNDMRLKEPQNFHEVDGFPSKEKKTMRKMMLFALAAASLVSVWAVSSPALAQDYKYCLQGREWGYPGNCQFSSYRQCMASASGTEAFCGVNPRYAYGSQRRGRHY